MERTLKLSQPGLIKVSDITSGSGFKYRDTKTVLRDSNLPDIDQTSNEYNVKDDSRTSKTIDNALTSN